MSHLGHLEGKQPYLGDLLTMVINHLLTGMILQVVVHKASIIFPCGIFPSAYELYEELSHGF